MKDCINKLLLTLALIFTAGTAALAETVYVITDGNGNYLSNNSGNIANATTFNPSTCLWTCSGSSSGTLSNDGYYLYYSRRSGLSLSTSSTTWTINSNRVYYTTSSWGSSTNNYITYSSSSWSVDTSTSSAANGYGVAKTSHPAISSLTVDYNTTVDNTFERVGDTRDYSVSAVSYTPAYNSYTWTDNSGNVSTYYASTDDSYVAQNQPEQITEASSYKWETSHPSNVTVTQSSEYPEQAMAEYVTRFTSQTNVTISATATIEKSKSPFMTADATVTGTATATLLSRDRADLQVSFDSNSLYIDQTTQLKITTDHDGTIAYSSANTSIAEVSSTGLVTAKGTDGHDETTVRLTVSIPQTEQYEAITRQISFTVKKRPVTLTLAYDKSSLTYGEAVPQLTTCKLTDNVSGSEVSRTVSFSSSITAINANASTGAIVVNSAGDAVVTATFSGDDTYLKAEAKFAISVAKAATSLSFDQPNYIAQLNHAFTSPKATLTPEGAGSVTYSYTSETAGLFTLDPSTGQITLGTLTGKATVTATFAGNDCYEPSSASYDILVTSKEIPDVEVTTNIEFYVDDKYIVHASTTASGKILFESSNESVLTISADGMLNAVGAGTATITITSPEDDTYMEYTVQYPITVKKYPTTLTITYPQSLYYTDFDGNIVPNVTIHDVVNGQLVNSQSRLSYSATPSSVLTVDETTGQVTMVGSGIGTVEVTFAGTRKFDVSTAHFELEIRKVPMPGTFVRLKDSEGKCLTSDGTSVTTTDTNDASTILWYGTDRSLLFYQCGLYLADATPQLAAVVDEGESGKTFTVTHEGDNYRISDGTNYLTSGESNLWKMEEVESLPLTFKSVGNGFSTFYCPVDLSCPAGVVAYYAAERNVDDTGAADYVITLQSVTGGYIPHGTPVVLQTNYIGTYDFYIVDETDTHVDDNWEGLAGTCPKINTASVYAGTQPPYTLQPTKAGSAGFYPWKSDSHAAIEPFRCYIPGTSAANANSFRFAIGNDPISSIDGIECAEPNTAVPIYNLQGIAVGTDLQKLPAGVYIQGGRKVYK